MVRFPGHRPRIRLDDLPGARRSISLVDERETLLDFMDAESSPELTHSLRDKGVDRSASASRSRA